MRVRRSRTIYARIRYRLLNVSLGLDWESSLCNDLGFGGLNRTGRSLVVTKHASLLDFERVAVIEGNHPVPGMGSVDAGNAALKFISQLMPDDLLVCLISGGGSALMTAPRIPLEDLQS